MKRMLLVLVMAIGFAGAQAEEAVKAPSFAELLPAKTMMMFEATDDGTDRWQETALGKIALEPEVQEFFMGIMGTIDAAYQNAGVNVLGMLGLTEEDLAGIRLSNVGFALVDFQMGQMPKIDAAFMIQASAGGDKLGKILESLRNATAMFLPVQLKEANVAGAKMHTLELPNHVIHIYAGGNQILVTTNRARMESMFGAARAAGTLQTAARFVQTKARMNIQKHAALFYADVPAIYERAIGIAKQMDSDDADEFHKMWRVLGLDAVDAVAFAEIPQGRGFRTEFAITMRERRGLFSVMQQGQASHRFASYVPGNSMIYAAERNNFGETFDRFVALAGEVEPDLVTDIEEGIAEANNLLGIDLRNDLVGSLGDDWALYVGPPDGGGLIPNIALFVSLRDKTRFRRTVGTMLDALKPMAEKERVSMHVGATKFRGHELEFVELAETRGDPIPVTPTWAFGEDFVVFGAWPHAVKNAVMKKTNSMANNPDFQRLSAEMPRTAMSSMYFDAKTLVGWLYNTATPIIQGMGGAANRAIAQFNPNVRVNLATMPTADVIVKHLGGAMTYTCVEPDCIRTGFVSDYGAAFLVLPVLAVAGVVAPVVIMQEGANEGSRARWRAMDAEREAAQARAKMRALEVEVARTRAELEKARGQLNQTHTANRDLANKLTNLEKQVAELKKMLDDK